MQYDELKMRLGKIVSQNQANEELRFVVRDVLVFVSQTYQDVVEAYRTSDNEKLNAYNNLLLPFVKDVGVMSNFSFEYPESDSQLEEYLYILKKSEDILIDLFTISENDGSVSGKFIEDIQNSIHEISQAKED